MSFDGLLCNTCDVEHNTADKWGETTSAIEAAVKCRIQYGNKIVRNFKGEDVLSTALVFFKKTATIGETDRLYFDGRWHGIQRIDRPQNAAAIHHIEVWVD